MNENISYLDNIRLSEGSERCGAVFRETAGQDRIKAAALINSRKLKFPCLFLLRRDIESYQLQGPLNPRNKAALNITESILSGDSEKPRSFSSKNMAEYTALKWMLGTGYDEDGLGDEYNMVLDAAVSVLINIYRDSKILPHVSYMIFSRSRKGRNIHDLVWAFFRIRDPYALKLIARHIDSSDPSEQKLARALLNIENSAESDQTSFLQWLNDNDPYLYFTGDSFQATSNPKFFNVDTERKYINHPKASRNPVGVPSYGIQPALPVNSVENKSLEVFKTLNDDDKTLLSDYSQKLRKENVSEWKTWMRYPADIQIKTAKGGREDVNDKNI